MWETSTKGLLSLVRRTKPSSFTYICEKMGSNLNDKQMDELACFAPGMIALGSSGYGSADSQKFLTLAEEGSCHNSVVPSSASLSARHGPSSTNAALLPSLRSSNNDSSKRDIGMSSVHCAEESSSRCELLKNCAQPSDQKTLKVRIKVGSDNLSTQKNAEIYTGLGLDVSPSSSLNESPTDSEGFSHEPLDAPEESPTSIL